MKVIKKIVYPLTIIIFIFIFIGLIVVKKYLNNSKYDEIEMTTNIIKEEIN